MSKPHSTTPQRPAKPTDDFPLFPHASGRWAKKILGRFHYFGPWRDPWGALRRYHLDKEDLEQGRTPVRREPGVSGDALTVEQLVARFLTDRKLLVESGEMESATWREYKRYGDRMIRVFGENALVEDLGPDDFTRLRADFQKTHKSLVSLKGDIRKTKVFFNWAGPGSDGQGLFERMPRFGRSFKAPSQSALNCEREDQPERVFTAVQIVRLLDAARPNMKAMIYLGLNCGYGDKDCGCLTFDKLGMDRGWAVYARTKNGNKRRCPLWPETIAALKAWLAVRPKPRDPEYKRHVFLTRIGQPFSSANLSAEFEKLVVQVGMTREEADFYDLRRTCASIGIQTNDDDAVRTIMGHKRAASDMLGVYNRLLVEDERLRRVSEHTRQWLLTGLASVRAKEHAAPSVVPFVQAS